MILCYGLSRKVTGIPLVVFTAGWIVYLIGFIKRMLSPTLLSPRWDNYTSIAAVGAGPIFILAATLHACLGGTASAAMGSLTAVAAAIFLVSLGNSSITSAQILYQYNSTTSTAAATTVGNSSTEELSLLYLGSTLSGGILCSLAVTVVLSLWGCYKDPFYDFTAIPYTEGHGEGRGQRVCKSPWFPGYAKKLAVPCIVFSFLGWGTIAGGHYHRVNTVTQEGHYFDETFKFDFGQWGACVLPPILLLFGLIHAGARGSASAVMGVVNAVLTGVTLTSLGYYMIHDVGNWLKDACAEKCDYTLPNHVAAICEIVGSFVMLFFWGSVLALWPFYQKKSPEGGSENMGLIQPFDRQRTNSQDYIIGTGEDGEGEVDL